MVFALLFLIFLSMVGSAQSSWPVIRMFGFLVSVLALAAYLLMGMSWYWAPWRILWRRFPILNAICYPDLNGTWYGMTQSNWPVVSKLREAASEEQSIDPVELAAIEPLMGEIALEIRASIFGISVRSSVGTGGGDPTTVMVRAHKNFETNKFELFYIYRQVTSGSHGAEESTHLGATMLEFRPGTAPSMEGSYWTRRNWREGMSTAGTISATRVNDQHVPADENIIEYTRERAVENLA
ncbi:MAG: hypothetical protein V3R85_01495 [Alphaproteobacteria bacterium]